MTRSMVGRRRVVVLQIALAVLFASLAALVARPAEAAYPGGNGFIVFENGFDLYAMPSDGSAAPTKIATAGTNRMTDPAFSPDGTQIAFSRDVAGVASIWIADFDPSGPALEAIPGWFRATAGPTDGAPTWSPDGTQIAFTRRSATLVSSGTATTEELTGVTLTDTAGTFQTDGVVPGMRVKNTTSQGTGTVLSVTDETTLVTTALVGGDGTGWGAGDTYTVTPWRRQIFTAPSNVANSTGTIVSESGTTPTYDDSHPVWSPGGTKIAFETNRNSGVSDIYTMNTSGTGQTNITTGSAFDKPARRPAWSPDGTRIAFDTKKPNAPGNANIWTVAASGGSAVNVTAGATGTDDDTQASFSPDGTQIAFVRAGSGGNRTYTIDTDGSNLALVQTANAPHNEPDWQPTVLGVDDAYTVGEGETLAEAAPGVLGNDETVEALPAATVTLGTDVINGTLVLATDGSFTYTHDGSETTADSFTYRPVQGGVQGSIATVTITITPINDAPVAVDDGPYATDNAGTVTQPAPGVLANDTDAEGDGLTAVLKTDPTNGTVTLNADGSFTYTHDGSDTTSDSFTYQAKDAKGAMSNVVQVSFTIGARPNGAHTTGLVDPGSGKWYLYDIDGKLKTSFFYGNPGDYPFMGDWDGDGVETPGLYRQSDGFVYLRNANTQGVADIRFFFGNPGDVPIAGDFNGDGFDTVSIYRPSNQTFFIINELGKNDGGLGAAEFFYVFGNPGDKPFVGDFDGDGVETVGLHRESTGLVYFRNTHTQGIADAQFFFGDPGDRLIAGDWTDDGTFTPALFRPSSTTMFFRYTNTQGNADNQFIPVPTDSTWLPVSGITE